MVMLVIMNGIFDAFKTLMVTVILMIISVTIMITQMTMLP